MRRTVALVVALLVAGAVAVGAVAVVRSHSSEAAPPPPPPTSPPPKPFRIVFPEGFTRRQMADRITAVDAIALHKRGVRPRLSESAYLKATAGKTRVPGFGRTHYRYEGFLFPATYDFFKNTPSKQLVSDQLDAFQRELGEGEPALRAPQEPDSVRRADHCVDDREGGAGTRGAASGRGRHLQPPPRADAARDRRDDPLRTRGSADRVASRVAAAQPDPVQHAHPQGPAADADRQSRASRRSRPPPIRRRSTTSTSCASRTRSITSSRRAIPRSGTTPTRTGTREDRLARLLCWAEDAVPELQY